MIRLLRAAGVAFAIAASVSAQQTRPVTPPTTPPLSQRSQAAVASVSASASQIVTLRLLNPREDWPGFAAGSTSKSSSLFAPLIAGLIAAGNSGDAVVRESFLVAVGRLALPADLERYVIPSLGDVNANVREAAANAIAMVLHDRKADGVDEATGLAVRALIEREPLEAHGSTAAMMLSVLGDIANEATGKSVERFLRQQSTLTIPTPVDFNARQGGALQGFEVFTRHFPGFGLDDETRVLLRKLSVPGLGFEQEIGPILPAIEALVHVRDGDVATIRAISQFRCDQSWRTRNSLVAHRPDCGWEFRRLGFQLMDGPRRDWVAVLNHGLSDPSFRVRIEAFRVYARDIPKSRTCAPLFDGLGDREPIVVVETIKMMDPKCDGEKEFIAERLKAIGVDLGDDLKAGRWHAASAAMEALVRFAPEDAAKMATEIASLHKYWNVRAAAARVAGALADEALAMRLFEDSEPNVRTEALYALIRMQSGKVAAVSQTALESNDYQLVLTAAAALSKAGTSSEWLPVVAKALQRLTKIGDDTSREARLALLARVQQANVAEKPIVDQLKALLEDYDPVVAWAAVDGLTSLTGEAFVAKPSRSAAPDTSLDGGCFEVILDGGQSFEIWLNGRIASLAKRHFYDGLTFHRAIADAFLEGGSPAGNYYTGADKRKVPSFGTELFVQDTLGPDSHIRGVVSLSRHELNTGSTQFFVELIDSPHLKREFTVIGKIGGCYRSDPSMDAQMDVVDRIMEGRKILLVSYRPPPYGAPPPLP